MIKNKKAKERKPYVPLAGSDFTEPPRPKEQAIALIYGLPGHGKTTLGLLYAPDPVAFFDVDKRGTHAARRAVRKGKVIHYLPVTMPRRVLKMTDQDLKREAEKELGKVRRNIDVAVKEGEKGNIRTVVFDTMTEFGGLINMAITGRVDKKQDDFGKSTHIVKSVIKDMIETFRSSPVNVIMLARAKELWVGRESTGKYTYQGFDTIEYEADWAGHVRLAKDRKTGLYRSQVHEMEITKAGITLSTLGEVYTEEEWQNDGPFVYACVQQFPGTDAETWK